MTKKQKILFLIQFPPPIHGASTMNKLVYERASSDKRNLCKLTKLDFARDLQDLRVFRAGKVFKAIKIFFVLCWNLVVFRPNKVFFSIVPHGYVLIRDSMYLFAIKILRPGAMPILHLHCSGLDRFNIRYKLGWFYRILFRRCTIIHLSKELMDREIAPLKIAKVQTEVVPNCIDPPIPNKPPNTREMRNILFLSNLLEQKGYTMLVEAVAILKGRFPEITLTIAGDYPSKNVYSNLIHQIAELGLTSNVSVTGRVEGQLKQQVLEKASIFVLPSKSEYFPLTILEAMANRVAVITSGRQNLSSLFTDNYHLLFLDELSPSGIANRLEPLLHDKTLLNSIAENGHIRWHQIQASAMERIDYIMGY